MFMLYGLLLGLLIGFATGGRPARLGHLQFRWGALAMIGLAIQLVLFSSPLTNSFGDAAPLIYVGSTLLVLAAVLRNAALPGLALVAVGATSNLIAIIGNGGFMPATPGALAALGKRAPEGYSNSAVVADPVAPLLTDIFALPTWLPFANVFSIGDVFITAGIAVAVAWGMHMRPDDRSGASRNLPRLAGLGGTAGGLGSGAGRP